MKERDIFIAALQKDDPVQRQVYLEDVCGHDHDLRQQVKELLQMYEGAGSFLQRPAVKAADAGAIQETGELRPLTESIGTVIGPYKLLQQLGEGGMGTVYMAEQTQPVQRKVALKIIKPGMDTRQVIARFEAERQALALMDHPNIAKVLDAGTTDTGRPYFVMELVKGVPITKYCDEHRLTPRQRLELFVPACEAVQHAHQKGIIHRDLKPSNVLVALYDGRPVPKVIDFGIAKATGQKLTDRTLFTEIGQVVGTLEYMSPEQAELNQLDIDTRSDIYSLGVLLYELLTGSTPLERKRLKEAAMLEVLRLIREEEPPKPSTRLSTTDEMPSVAANRGLEPKKLSGLVRGELDWIVMKALDKDRNRRYETANGFARDIQRYLDDEPVQACPPSTRYRLRKFARRNKTALAVAGLILFFITLLGSGAGWVVRDRAARHAKAANDLDLALDRAELFQEQGKSAEALAALERAELLAGEAPHDSARDVRLAALKEGLSSAARDQEFIARFEEIRLRAQSCVDVKESRFAEESAFPELREALRQYGIPIGELAPAQAATLVQGRPELVRRSLIAAFDECLLMRALRGGDPQTREWLLAAQAAADNDSWRVRVRKAIFDTDGNTLAQLAREVDVRKQPPNFLLIVGRTLPAEMKSTRLELFRRIQSAYPADLWANHQLALVLMEGSQFAEAIRYFTAALALRPDNPGILLNRGSALKMAGELDAAIADLRQSLTLAPQYAMAHAVLGGALADKDRWDEAMVECQEAVALDPKLALAWCHRGLVHAELHQYEKGLADYSEAIQLDPKFALAWNNRGRLHVELHQYEKGLADCSEAIKLDPKLARAWSDRGNAYLQLHEYEKAIADCTEAIKLDPKLVQAWYVRGGAHADLHQYEKAVSDCTKAIEVNPADAPTHYNLACILAETGRRDQAIAEYREAIQLKPDYAEAHCNQGHALLKQGEFRLALAALRRGHELGSKNPGWPYPSEQWVRECERLLELDGQLAGFLAGNPASPAKRIELAGLCILKRLNVAAARFFGDAFEAEPKLAENMQAPHRYNAACVAALAGCGQGKDADKQDDKDKARLRGQALVWLRVDLQGWRRLLDEYPEKARSVVGERMLLWQQDNDFAGVRGPEALAKLPEAEREGWQELWKDVAELQRRAQAKTNPKKSDTK